MISQDRTYYIRSSLIGGITWILTVLLFSGLIFYGTKYPVDPSKLHTWIPVVASIFLVVDVLIGIFSFIIFISSLSKLSIIKQKEAEEGKASMLYKPLNLWFIISIFLLIVVAYLLGANKSAFLGISVTSSPSPVPTPLPTLTETPTVDADPLIDCGSTASECKGTFVRVRRSQCPHTVCCGFNNGKWVLYATVEQCKKDQEAEKNNKQQVVQPKESITSGAKVPVYLSYRKITVYCPSQNVDAVKAIDASLAARDSEWGAKYQRCIDEFSKNDPCVSQCRTSYYDELSTCSQICDIAGLISQDCTDCNNDVTNNRYPSCLAKCPNEPTSCAPAEMETMYNQIDNLCK